MTEAASLFNRLRQRRVFPIVGMYVAACWLVIELGDWVTERFGLPGVFTSYVFIAMIVMLPAVAVFAYNHGAPGKDRWTRTEKVLIPSNAVLAIVAIYFVSPVLDVEAATEMVEIEDETGTLQAFEVPKLGYHKEVLGFFWTNASDNPELKWLSYGLPLMLGHDINRVSPLVTMETPFDDSYTRSRMERQGFESLTDVPRGLALEITRDRLSEALVIGSFDLDGDAHIVAASLIDAENGKVIRSFEARSGDWFSAIDETAAAILDALGVEPGRNHSDDPVSQHLTGSLEAVRLYSSGALAMTRDNDYPLAIAELTRAVEIDPLFAEAHGTLSFAHYFSGTTEAAGEAATNALRNSYRLSSASEFILKANRYIYKGDFERAERAIDVWTQVQPNSTQALDSFIYLTSITGTEEGLGKAGEALDRLLELRPNDYLIYLRKGLLEQQRGNFTAAADHVQMYLDNVPDSGGAYRQLSTIFQAQGELDQAQAALEKASILSDAPFESEIALARLEARRGRYADAEVRLESLANEAQTAERTTALLGAQWELAIAQGQIERGIAIYRELNEAAKVTMPPTLRLMSVEAQLASLMAARGETSEAVAHLDRLVTMLEPPISWYFAFTYAQVYDLAGDRERYRYWADQNAQRRDQYPELLHPIVDIQTAQVAIWDDDIDAALAQLDGARDALGQSFLNVAQDSLTTVEPYIGLARLYIEAGAPEQARPILDDVLRVFPASGHARLVQAELLIKEGETAGARVALDKALAVWADADEEYVYLQQARELKVQVSADG